MSKQTSVLLRHLPEIYHDSDALRTLLTAFDEVLFGSSEQQPSLEQLIDSIPTIFQPNPGQASTDPLSRTRYDFLPWLAQWVAVEHAHAMPEEQYRQVIARIVPLYALRGTKKYLDEVLALFFPEIGFSINDEALPTMTVGQSRIGRETRLGGDLPFYFYVKIRFPGQVEADANPDKELLDKICSVIDSAKPAHTAYQLEYEFEENDKNLDSFSNIE